MTEIRRIIQAPVFARQKKCLQKKTEFLPESEKIYQSLKMPANELPGYFQLSLRTENPFLS